MEYRVAADDVVAGEARYHLPSGIIEDGDVEIAQYQDLRDEVDDLKAGRA